MTLERLRAALAAHRAASYPFESPSAEHLPHRELLRAAVLVPLFEHDGEPHVLLTRRHANLRRHAGQVSFPGGRIEPGEEPLAAALRESHEEVGLEPAQVEVLGQLDETLVLVTGFRLIPFVGRIPYPYPYVAHPHEVDAILYVPLAELSRGGAHWTEPREAYGIVHEVHVYQLPAVTIWGATARVLHQLLAVWGAS
jgi:8-oxo-dGTP pyrophosphatase MutT (NUDIX family)